MNRLLVIAFALFAPLGALAADFVPLAPIPGLTQVNGKNLTPDQAGIATFLGNLYIWLIGAAAILAVIMIIWGGLEIATKESVARHANGVARIRAALFGLLLVLSPVLVFTVINPQILNLNVNFQALETGWTDYVPSNTTTTTTSNGGSIETTTCGSDNCAGKIASCPPSNRASCIDSTNHTYSPGSGGAASGTCKSGDRFECASVTGLAPGF